MLVAITLLLAVVGGAATVAAFTLGDDPPFGLGADADDPTRIQDDPRTEDRAGEPDRPDEEASDTEGSVDGAVMVDADPASGVRITVVDPQDNEVASTLTDTDGTWSVSLPAPETYDLLLDADSLPDDAQLETDEEARRTVEVSEGDTETVDWRLDAAPPSPLAEAVAQRLADEEGVASEELVVQCPDLDRYVAGELHTCEVEDAPQGVAIDAALVSIHAADGEHVAMPWTDPTDPPDLDEVIDAAGGSGQFCADVHEAGYGYQEAVAYWYHEGQPDRMDADRDGIPCGTVYPPEEINAYWDAVQQLPD